MKQSSMFLCDTTNIDHAYINEQGKIIGGSYRPKFVVTGAVDTKENVVVDFSTIKKSIKKLIDHNDNGYDHKLWWIEGVSKGTINFVDGTVSVKTPHVEVSGPANIVKVVKKRSISEDITQYLKDGLAEEHPGIVNIETSITTDFDIHPCMDTRAHAFTYVHGLRESTSWGCQNIGHGHLSYIAADTGGVRNAADALLTQIAKTLNETVFVWDTNIVNNQVGNQHAKIFYNSSRGPMTMSINNATIVLLHTETTVEHLVDYVAARWYNELVSHGVKRLFVSEGLSKGACKFIGE